MAGSLAGEVVRIAELPVEELPWQGIGSVLVDTLAAACAGAGAPSAEAARREIGLPAGRARVWGTADRTDAIQAALVNGIAAHVLELDDIYAPGTVHPGSVVIPAALAVADEVEASGTALARAVAAGYEVCGRISADLGPSHYRNWHTTGTGGAVGAAAAAALLLAGGGPVDAATVQSSLALAATMSGGLQQLFRSDASGKPLHAGHGAMAGVIAAKTARAGIGGAADIFEGPAGMGVAMGGSGRWTHSTSATGGFVIDASTIKPYPCCGHSFAAVDGALQLRGQLGSAPLDAVERVRVDTYRAGIEVAGIAVPASAADTRFSIPFLVALALADGTIDRAELTPSRLDDPAFKAVVATTEVRLDDELEAAFPANRGARVTVTTTDGRTLVAFVPNRSGSPESPLSPEALRSKYDGLLSHVTQQERDRLHTQLVDLSGVARSSALALPDSLRPITSEEV
ncbi:MmgE/PrpD family protein [Streptomyces brasiliensis]|uniref:MmgE/PrpD family protein n=1 Tax=Streptomyces brasiliensis TaxID=1954 RepID=UPI001670BD37|nr:MmgE/PrpD family protein [Streptomyces brasiliensis]